MTILNTQKIGWFLSVCLVVGILVGSPSDALAAIGWPASTPYGGTSPDGLLRDYLVPDPVNNRVGIGTSIPAVRFDLYGTSGNADTRFVITEEGRVGIGTASPQEKLHLEKRSARITPKNPMPVGAITDADETAGERALDGAWGIEVFGDYAYVSGFADDGIAIIDVSDPADPKHIRSVFDSEESMYALDGAASVVVAGEKLFVLSRMENAMGVYDISDPTAAVLKASKVTDLPAMVRALQTPFDVEISGKYAFITSDSDDGVAIVDISGDPDYVGHFLDADETTGERALRGAYGIDIVGNYAYVAAFDDNGLEIIDISDPKNPTHAGSIFDTASIALSGAYDVAVSGKFAYVSSYSDDGVAIIDVSDPTNPTHVASFTDTEERALNGAKNLVVSGEYLFVTSHIDNGIQVIDISDSYNPSHAGAIFDDATTTLAEPYDIDIVGNYLYVTSYAEDGVQILDISGFQSPSALVGTLRSDFLEIKGDAQIANHLYAHQSVNVGGGGVYSQGPFSFGPGDSSFGGKLLINTLNDPGSSFDVNVGGDVKVYNGGYRNDGTCIWSSCTSDKRAKTNIAPLSGSLQKILQLTPSTFRYKDETYGKGIHTGLIAQEVEEVFPEWVTTRPNGYKAINYSSQLQIHLLSALQELKTKSDVELESIAIQQQQMRDAIDSLQKK
jgi:hypothetical protein